MKGVYAIGDVADLGEMLAHVASSKEKWSQRLSQVTTEHMIL